jgi:membrane-associated phospholipid phosphatase/tRNA A-37 threonylcarbamoyl transferase component Bud32
MNLPTDHAPHVRVLQTPSETTRRTRRPSGEPPPLPRHLQTSGVEWLVAAAVVVGAALLVFAGGLHRVAVDISVVDTAVVRGLQDMRVPGSADLFRTMSWLGSWAFLNVAGPALFVALLALRRFRHLVVWLAVVTVLQIVVGILLAKWMHRPRLFGVEFRADWGGWAMPSLVMTLFTAGLVAILYSLVPAGRRRNLGKWIVTALVVLVGLSRAALGVDSPSDMLVGVAIGVTVPLLAFRWFTPDEVFPVSYRRGRAAHLDVGGARGEAIRRALQDQLGVAVDEVRPFGLSGSAGSTPLRIGIQGDPPHALFGKLYAKSHLQADRWYKLGRELLYGQLEDEKPFNAVRRLVQQEDYALSLMQRAGLPSPVPYGFAEITPEREYLLVTEFFDGAVELGEAEVDEQVIDDGLGIVRKLWDAGLAHRDIKPANLLVRDGRLLLIDVAFVEARPTPWRQAVDLANMMLCLALRSDPDQVFRRARREFSVEEITEGFAAARGLALPSQLRRMMRAQGRDLHAEFVKLLPRPPRPVSVQRWSARRLVLLAATLAVLVLAYDVVIGGRANPLRRAGDIYADALSCTDPEPLWLLAQSVPTASNVPCVRSLPAGWTLGHVTVTRGRSTLTFDHDRAGAGAMVASFTARCDPGGAAAVGTDGTGVSSYQRVEASAGRIATTRFDVLPGGCLTTRLVAPPEQQAQLAAEIPEMLDFRTRQQLERTLDRRSNGRLHLDAVAHG